MKLEYERYTIPLTDRKSFLFMFSTTRLFQVSIVLILAAPTILLAKDYKVEVLLFENTQADPSTEAHAYEAPREMKNGSEHWHIDPSMLIEEAKLIHKSDEYDLRYTYSWGIESLPYQDSANFTVTEVDSNGYIKIYAEDLLFANIDLDYKGFRMREKRRLKLNEKHYFDHPKFGLLIQVSRLEVEEDAPITE